MVVFFQARLYLKKSELLFIINLLKNIYNGKRIYFSSNIQNILRSLI